MGVKEDIDHTVSILDQVRSKINPEDLDKVSTLLEEAKSRVKNHGDSWHVANIESRDRKEKLRDKDKTIESISEEREEFKRKYEGFDTTELVKERNTYKEKYHVFLNREKNAFINFYDQNKEHPNWEKAKGKFKLPEGEDGKLNWDSLNNDDLDHNLMIKNDLESLEYFKTEIKGGPEGGKGVPLANLDIESIHKKRNAGDQTWREDYEAYKKRRTY